ncbi:Acetyl-coenzyme A synthetase, N-terminal domain [Phytophthora cactorum]|nr:Acetyl-coenzyme A synthetase, N-terminal domain [Phytophthora cactorum]
MGDSAGVSFNGVYPVPGGFSKTAHVQSMEQYEAMYKLSLEDPESFWGELGRKNLDWFREFDQAVVGTVNKGDTAWFLNGETNVSVNCIDRHVKKHPNKVAIIWEADEIGEGREITYTELLEETCRIANAMKHAGVRRGDTVAIYMPMIPEIALLGRRSARPLVDAQSQWVFTADEGKRGGRTLPLKQIVDHAVDGLDFVRKVFMFKRTRNPEELLRHRPYCPAEFMNSEDLMFILYTSGSTGTPKGIAHTTAGYLLYTMMTAKYTFDLHDDDIFACVADAGWITGHSYIIYGPGEWCDHRHVREYTHVSPPRPVLGLVQRHKVTKFYTAPTAIRALMARGNDKIKEYDLSSLKILGSVGEPINPEAWKWYYEVVGNRQCYIADTYWQTRLVDTLAWPGSCTKPFFGIDFVVTDEQGNEIKGNDIEGQLCIRKPWPGMARTVYGDHNRYLQVYMSTHKGLYFTGDGCRRDKDGYYFITGRIDDVLCTSGHRIGTAEIESAMAAVIGIPHRIKGEGICCFVTLVDGVKPSKDVEKELVQQVRAQIGAFATPDLIVLVPGLPKTRSGKIMRRVLRKISHGEEDSLGDVSTLADPSVVPTLITNTKAALVGKTF